MKTFGAQIWDFVRMTEKDLNDVRNESIQDMMDMAQTPTAQGGRMPVVTSNLRNSLASAINGAEMAKGGDSYLLVVAQLNVTDTAEFVWTAEYARRINSGFTSTDALGRAYNYAGTGYRDAAAAMWQTFIDRNAHRVRNRR